MSSVSYEELNDNIEKIRKGISMLKNRESVEKAIKLLEDAVEELAVAAAWTCPFCGLTGDNRCGDSICEPRS